MDKEKFRRSLVSKFQGRQEEIIGLQEIDKKVEFTVDSITKACIASIELQIDIKKSKNRRIESGSCSLEKGKQATQPT